MKKTATVVGLGISGYGAACLLLKKGWRVKVTEAAASPELREHAARLTKSDPAIQIEIGTHTRGFIKDADLVVTSPGVKDDAPPLQWARAQRIPVIDEIELGYRFCPERIIAVTGTNGKSTTTTLIGEILKQGGYDVVVCGNIGTSFCKELMNPRKKSIFVLEVSSFQLQRTVHFRPAVAVFLNITQNHFDRHKDFNEYLRAKRKIFENQKRSDWAILNYEDTRVRSLQRHSRSRILFFGNGSRACKTAIKDGVIAASITSRPKDILQADEMALKGEHNRSNAMAAILAGLIFKVRPEGMRRALKNFTGLTHRFEHVGRIDGVDFINDSKATTVDAAMYAIRSIQRPLTLIAGGRDKGSNFTVLRDLVRQRVRTLVLIGEARGKIRKQLAGTTSIREAPDLRSAVSLSFDLAHPGGVVLLSPMCASFDMFKNFEERGDFFKRHVQALGQATNVYQP